MLLESLGVSKTASWENVTVSVREQRSVAIRQVSIFVVLAGYSCSWAFLEYKTAPVSASIRMADWAEITGPCGQFGMLLDSMGMAVRVSASVLTGSAYAGRLLKVHTAATETANNAVTYFFTNLCIRNKIRHPFFSSEGTSL